jgi:hypothetical protein
LRDTTNFNALGATNHLANTVEARTVEHDTPATPMMTQLRHTVALPVYSVALILSYLNDLIGVIAAKVAGDERPE